MVHYVLKCLLLVALPVCCVRLVHSQEVGTLKARFVYGGDASEAEKINITKDLPFCGLFAHRSERLVVDKATNQIKNVVLSVFNGRGGSELPPAERTPKTATLATVNCRFEPHVLCLRAGDTLEVVQRDPVGYGGVNLGFLINPSRNFVVTPNAPRVIIKIEKAEPTPIQVTCMSHSWMHAYLIVLDHPFVSVSDDQGKVEIKDLPAGNELVFRLFHESTRAISEVEIDGQAVTLDRNLFRLVIKPGMNDLGTIVIPAAAFGRD